VTLQKVIFQENDLEACHYFPSIVVIGMTTGKVRLYKLWMMKLPIKGSRLNNMKTEIFRLKGHCKTYSLYCGSSLLKKKNSTRLGQLRKSNGEFSRSAQDTPTLTAKKLRPTRFRATSLSVSLSDKSVFTHGFINSTLSTATFILQYKLEGFTHNMVY